MTDVRTTKGAELLDFGGGRVRILVTNEQSGGAFFLIEDTAPRGKTTPLHRHPFDETFYVIEGELLLHVDGEEHTAGPGDAAVAHRGSAHAFIVTSESARWLGLVTPGELGERFFREGGDPVTDPDAPIPPLDIHKVKDAGERTGAMEVLGPPPFSKPS
jgi:quercetin dioxygenase-like cupin family protein